MYHKGEVEVWRPDAERDNLYGERDAITDARDDLYGVGNMPAVCWPVARLPHSCGDWVIGNTTCVRLLIKDLRKAVRVLEGVETETDRAKADAVMAQIAKRTLVELEVQEDRTGIPGLLDEIELPPVDEIID